MVLSAARHASLLSIRVLLAARPVPGKAGIITGTYMSMNKKDRCEARIGSFCYLFVYDCSIAYDSDGHLFICFATSSAKFSSRCCMPSPVSNLKYFFRTIAVPLSLPTFWRYLATVSSLSLT